MNIKVLEQIGLTKGEVEVYLILLKIGEATASEIAKYTKIARPNVYDYLNKLKEKRLVSFVNKNNKTYYLPSSPERLLEFIDEKRDILQNNLKELLSLYKPKKQKPTIEVYEGAEGLKTVMNDIIKEKKEFVGWGGSDKIRDYLPDYFIERYINERKKKKIKAKLLYTEGEPQIKINLTKFKSIPKEFTSPSTTVVYSDRVVILIYTPIPVTIVIKSKELSESYKKHFELLWKKV